MIKQQDFFQIFIPLLVVFGVCDANAAVAQRASVSRAQVVARAPVVSSVVADDVVPVAETVVDTTVDVVEEPVFEFEDKTNQFDSAIGASSGAASGAVSDEDLAKMIRQQRAAADASSATKVSANAARSGAVSGQNACDIGLRKCMSAKCGNDFAKCAGDTDMVWGSKMDLCRRDLKCSGHEYSVFTAEIKADRDANAKLANFNAIVDCGNRYNSCIVNECGATFSKCVGKSAGDTAIAKCKKIQTECNKQDNGLASRMMNVFATVRQDAEKQILRDEKRLYELRELMASACRGMGAMFDERSLDCVYTVNFFANNSSTPYASKKSYAGGVFSCEPGWFGIDVTTFKENAYRLTRAQTAASSAMLGAGVGVAAGAISSGAIDRALETNKAKKALKEAEKENGTGEPSAESGGEERATDGNINGNNASDKKAGRQEKRDAKQDCEDVGGQWLVLKSKCKCTKANGVPTETSNPDQDCHKRAGNQNDNNDNKSDNDNASDNKAGRQEKPDAKQDCEDVGGQWLVLKSKCKCTKANGVPTETSNPDQDCHKRAGNQNDNNDNKSDNDSDKEKAKRSNKNQSLQERCDAVGGSMSGDKCSCRSKANENNMMLTKNPEQDCIPQTFAWSSDKVSESASESLQEKVTPEKTKVTEENIFGFNKSKEKEEKSQKKSSEEKKCINSGGAWSGDFCSCPDGKTLNNNGGCEKTTKTKADTVDTDAVLSEMVESDNGVKFWDGFVMTSDGRALPNARIDFTTKTGLLGGGKYALTVRADGSALFAAALSIEDIAFATVTAPGCTGKTFYPNQLKENTLMTYVLDCDEGAGSAIQNPVSCGNDETLISGIVVNGHGTFIDSVQILADGAKYELTHTELQDELRDPSYFAVCAPRDTWISFINFAYKSVVLNSDVIKNRIIVMEKNK